MALTFAQDDAEEELLSKALYVDDCDNPDKTPYDPNKPSATAEEYLKGVVREAKMLDDVSIGKVL